MNVPQLEAIERPNGTVYRPRKLVAYPVTEPDDDSLTGSAVVFGTHDPERARDLAQRIVDRDLGAGYVVTSPGRVWWRDGFEGGRRGWVTDEVRGRAGVYFSEIEEVSS